MEKENFKSLVETYLVLANEKVDNLEELFTSDLETEIFGSNISYSIEKQSASSPSIMNRSSITMDLSDSNHNIQVCYHSFGIKDNNAYDNKVTIEGQVEDLKQTLNFKVSKDTIKDIDNNFDINREETEQHYRISESFDLLDINCLNKEIIPTNLKTKLVSANSK